MAQGRGSDDKHRFTMSWKQILTVVASLGYVASPIDLLSEAFLGPLGLPDDIVALVIAGATFAGAVRKYRAGRVQPGTTGTTGTAGAPSGGPGTRAPGSKGPRIVVDPEDPTTARKR